MTTGTNLSDRVRSGVEAAPWVLDEIKRMEAELDLLQKPSLILNGHQLREALGLIAPDGSAEQLEQELVLCRYPEGAHSGLGIYAYFEECPEEGSTLIDGTSQLGEAFVPALMSSGAIPQAWRTMMSNLVDALEDLNNAHRDNIDDDMAEPEAETELCDATDELIEEAKTLLASVTPAQVTGALPEVTTLGTDQQAATA